MPRLLLLLMVCVFVFLTSWTEVQGEQTQDGGGEFGCSKYQYFQNQTGNCRCKEYGTTGEACDICQEGFFPRFKKPLRCSKCWCNLATDHCEAEFTSLPSAKLLKSDVEGFTFYFENRDNVEAILEDYGRKSVIGRKRTTNTVPHYWLLPEDLSGNMLLYYGGVLRVFLSFVSISGYACDVRKSVIIKSSSGSEVYSAVRHKVHSHENKVNGHHINGELEVVLKEDLFVMDRKWSSPRVSRRKFLEILSSIGEIQIRVDINKEMRSVTLKSVMLSTGPSGIGYSSVERCSCPAGYAGLSCEKCADGYFWNPIKKGCYKCSCNPPDNFCPFAGGLTCSCTQSIAVITCRNVAQKVTFQVGTQEDQKSVTISCSTEIREIPPVWLESNSDHLPESHLAFVYSEFQDGGRTSRLSFVHQSGNHRQHLYRCCQKDLLQKCFGKVIVTSYGVP